MSAKILANRPVASADEELAWPEEYQSNVSQILMKLEDYTDWKLHQRDDGGKCK